MPFTAFHVVLVWPIHVRWPHRWDLLALSWGAVVPDLEIVTIYPLTGDAALGRGIMHSILGIVTVNLLLALFAARVLTPWIVIRLDRRYPNKGWRIFAGQDFIQDSKALSVAALSAIVGGLTHLGIDLTHHLDTPIFWPWRAMPLQLLPWAGSLEWTYAVNAAFGVIFFAMILRWLGR